MSRLNDFLTLSVLIIAPQPFQPGERLEPGLHLRPRALHITGNLLAHCHAPVVRQNGIAGHWLRFRRRDADLLGSHPSKDKFSEPISSKNLESLLAHRDALSQLLQSS